MIHKYFNQSSVKSEAVYSNCENYRYTLTREWDAEKQKVLFIMLNPSTADETKNDATVERCERRARNLNFGSVRICNIFAWRETNPFKLKQKTKPIGKDNNKIIQDSTIWANDIICAWGTHGSHLERDEEIKKLLSSNGCKLYHLGLTKNGHPKHPLYVPYSQDIIRWRLKEKPV